MKCLLKTIYKIFSVFILLFLFSSTLYAQGHSQNQDVEAVIDLSVCGDGVKEGSEDCDGEDLNSNNCRKLGFERGDLSCDIACDFDTSSCSGVLTTPTPSPTSSSTTTSTSTVSSSDSNTSSNENTNREDNLIERILKNTDQKLELIKNRFDKDNSGKIEVYEVFNTVQAWVEDWKINIEVQTALAKGELDEEGVIEPEKCDLNGDKVCNVIDLSILLYYIDR